MKSLSDLNTYVRSPLEVNDERPAGVRFEGLAPTQVVVQVASNRIDLPMPLEVSEIINYQTANLRWRLSVVTFGTPITGTTFSFPPGFVVPTGITVTNVANQFIEIGGFKTPEEWQEFSVVRWNLPANYASFSTWWVASSIRWFDGEFNGQRTIDWDVYDPQFYRLSVMDSVFSMQTFSQKIKEAIVLKGGVFTLSVAPFASVNQSAELNSAFAMTPIITRVIPLFINTLSAVAQMPQAIPLRIKSSAVSLSGAFNATVKATYSPADSIIMKVSSAGLQANVNYTASAVNSSSANFAAIIDNTRLRHAFDTVEFNSNFGIVTDNVRAKLFNVDLTASAQADTEGTKFKGLVNEVFAVTGNMTIQAVKTVRTIRTLSSVFTSSNIVNVRRSAFASVVSISSLTSSAIRVQVGLLGWGENSFGQLGLGNTLTPTLIRTPIGLDYTKVAAGRYHVIAIKGGELFAWGRNLSGVLGQGSTDPTFISTPTQIGTASDWINVWSSGNTCIAQKSNGTIWGWGANNEGQVGIGTYSGTIPDAVTTPILNPTQISFDTNWQDIFMAANHVIGIKSNGEAYVWGSNSVGQLGLGQMRNDALDSIRFRETRPTRFGTLTNWVGGGTTSGGSFLINSSGEMFAFGGNSRGHLGLGYTSTSEFLPIQVSGTGWQKVTGAFSNSLQSIVRSHTIAIRNGELYAVGDNNLGQLGTGNTTDATSFIRIGSFSDWSDISVSIAASASFAIRNGSLYSWGSGGSGVLGNESTTSRNVPTIIDTLPLWGRITAGEAFAVALGPAIL
jgi:alpha-tubulin suppressor-like RCC1 family protein